MLLIINVANMKYATKKGGAGWVFEGGRTYPLSVFVFIFQCSKILVNSIQIQVRKSPIFIYIFPYLFFHKQTTSGALVMEGSLCL
jgi:hypothetical protein